MIPSSTLITAEAFIDMSVSHMLFKLALRVEIHTATAAFVRNVHVGHKVTFETGLGQDFRAKGTR